MASSWGCGSPEPQSGVGGAALDETEGCLKHEATGSRDGLSTTATLLCFLQGKPHIRAKHCRRVYREPQQTVMIGLLERGLRKPEVTPRNPKGGSGSSNSISLSS